MLRPGGLMIFQSYLGGIDHRFHIGYLPACAAQLSGAGMTLLDVYAFQQSIGIKLFVAVNGKEVIPRGALTRFHGRAAVAEPIERIFQA